MKTLSRSNSMGFCITGLSWNILNPQLLLLHGTTECVVFNVETSGSQKGIVKNRFHIDLMLEAFGAGVSLIKVRWLPNSLVHAVVATNTFIKIYNLSEDLISPMITYTLIDGSIKDFSINKEDETCSRIFVASSTGRVYTAVIENDLKSMTDGDEQLVITDAIEFPEDLQIEGK
jgi:E3 ubiquitin-protein ligase UBR4